MDIKTSEQTLILSSEHIQKTKFEKLINDIKELAVTKIDDDLTELEDKLLSIRILIAKYEGRAH